MAKRAASISGKRDGLRVDLPVRTAEGLVGRVSEVSETSSRVVLLGDANCRVPAEVLDPIKRQTIDQGVITGGAGVLDESMVELSFLSKPEAVKPGASRADEWSQQYFSCGNRHWRSG